MKRIFPLAVLVLISDLGLCGPLILPAPNPGSYQVVVCEPHDPKKEVVYIDARALPLADDEPLRKGFASGVCAEYSESSWEMYVTNYWRKSEIKVGTKTDKGLVVEVKLPVVKVQTKGAVQWFRVDDLFPEIRKSQRQIKYGF